MAVENTWPTAEHVSFKTEAATYISGPKIISTELRLALQTAGGVRAVHIEYGEPGQAATYFHKEDV